MARAPAPDLLHIGGAGPAGISAALTAARAGVPALIHERRPRLAARFHGDFQGIENYSTRDDALEELERIGITAAFDVTPFREACIYDGRGRAWAYRSSSPLFYMIRRGAEPGRLDAGLLRQALDAGVEVRFGEAMPPDQPGILATGPRGSFAIVVGYLFPTSLPDMVLGVLSDRLAPKGYAYLVVCRGRATLATCLFQDCARYAVYLDRTVRFFQERTDVSLDGARRFGGTGHVRSAPRWREDGRLVVGEAAGFQDALWGFGLRMAMLTGHFAARALLEGEPARYREWWETRCGGLLRASFANRFVFGHLGETGYRAFLRRLGAAPDARDWLRGHYAPTRWKELFGMLVGRAQQGKG